MKSCILQLSILIFIHFTTEGYCCRQVDQFKDACLGPAFTQIRVHTFTLTCPGPTETLLVISAHYKINLNAGDPCPPATFTPNCLASDLTDTFERQCNQRGTCSVPVRYDGSQSCSRPATRGSGGGTADGRHYAVVEYWCTDLANHLSMNLCNDATFTGNSADINSNPITVNDGYLSGAHCYCDIAMEAEAMIQMNATMMVRRPAKGTCDQKVTVQNLLTSDVIDICSQGHTAWFSTCVTRSPRTLRLQYKTTDASVLTKFAISLTTSHTTPFRVQCGWAPNQPTPGTTRKEPTSVHTGGLTFSTQPGRGPAPSSTQPAGPAPSSTQPGGPAPSTFLWSSTRSQGAHSTVPQPTAAHSTLPQPTVAHSTLPQPTAVQSSGTPAAGSSSSFPSPVPGPRHSYSSTSLPPSVPRPDPATPSSQATPSFLPGPSSTTSPGRTSSSSRQPSAAPSKGSPASSTVSSTALGPGAVMRNTMDKKEMVVIAGGSGAAFVIILIIIFLTIVLCIRSRRKSGKGKPSMALTAMPRHERLEEDPEEPAAVHPSSILRHKDTSQLPKGVHNGRPHSMPVQGVSVKRTNEPDDVIYAKVNKVKKGLQRADTSPKRSNPALGDSSHSVRHSLGDQPGPPKDSTERISDYLRPNASQHSRQNSTVHSSNDAGYSTRNSASLGKDNSLGQISNRSHTGSERGLSQEDTLNYSSSDSSLNQQQRRPSRGKGKKGKGELTDTQRGFQLVSMDSKPPHYSGDKSAPKKESKKKPRNYEFVWNKNA